MASLENKITRFNNAVAACKDAPPNESTQLVKKRLSDIRDLLIKADVAMDTGRSPAAFFSRIDEVLDSMDKILYPPNYEEKKEDEIPKKGQ